MSRPVARRVTAALLLGAPLLGMLAGCDVTEPYQRPGMWTPTGSNAANLAAMVQNPGDLVQGRAAGDSDGVVAAAAVERLRDGRVKPLPNSDGGTAPAASAASPGAASN